MADLEYTHQLVVEPDATAEAEAARVVADVRTAAAGHVLDAVECLTDNHVRRLAAEGWLDVLSGTVEARPMPAEQVGERIAAAMKSLAAAQADLADLDQYVGVHVADVAYNAAQDRGVHFIAYFWHTDQRAWRWTCEACGHTQLASGVPLADVIAISAAHLERFCHEHEAAEVGATADGRTVRGRLLEDEPGEWRWLCSGCPASSIGTWPTAAETRDALVRHVEALRPEVHP